MVLHRTKIRSTIYFNTFLFLDLKATATLIKEMISIATTEKVAHPPKQMHIYI